MKKSGLATFLFVSFLTCFVLSCKQSPTGNESENKGYVLPQPTPEFKGVIGTTYKDSTPDKIPVINPPKGAPNVLMTLIDDSGFGQWGTFGGQTPTPNLDRLAQIRHAATCASTLLRSARPHGAALLTGRNHHSAGMGVITELADAYPGYSGQIPKSCGHGVRRCSARTATRTEPTSGKNHQIAGLGDQRLAGPFDRWPRPPGLRPFLWLRRRRGQPVAATRSSDDTTPVEMEIPKGREGHYTLNDALADEVIEYIHHQKSITPDRPFFVYYRSGCDPRARTTSRKEWIDEVQRPVRSRLGRVPRRDLPASEETRALFRPTPSSCRAPPEIPACDSLTPDQKRVAARLMEAFAAYTAQTDYEVGRRPRCARRRRASAQATRSSLWEIGDNGASMEGTLLRSLQRIHRLSRRRRRPVYLIRAHRRGRRPQASYNHYPRRLGMGREHTLPMGQAGRLALRRHPQSARHLLARAASRMSEESARSSTTSSTSPLPSWKPRASRSRLEVNGVEPEAHRGRSA